MPQLDDREREYRRVLGERLKMAADLNGLKPNRLAELVDQPVANMYQYMRGMRHIPPAVIDRIAQVTGVSVESLLADEGAPMEAENPDGMCPAGYVVESATPRIRLSVLLICDKRRHDDAAGHHDPRGLDWRSAPSV